MKLDLILTNERLFLLLTPYMFFGKLISIITLKLFNKIATQKHTLYFTYALTSKHLL